MESEMRHYQVKIKTSAGQRFISVLASSAYQAIDIASAPFHGEAFVATAMLQAPKI
jgi:hypothetical protein